MAKVQTVTAIDTVDGLSHSLRSEKLARVEFSPLQCACTDARATCAPAINPIHSLSAQSCQRPPHELLPEGITVAVLSLGGPTCFLKLADQEREYQGGRGPVLSHVAKVPAFVCGGEAWVARCLRSHCFHHHPQHIITCP